MQHFYLILTLFALTIIVLNTFSRLLQRFSLPAPTLALLTGVLLGPHALGLFDLNALVPEPIRFLEEVARLTLAVGLVGVALRLPHGYWRENLRWVVASIGVSMLLMFGTASVVLWAGLGLPLAVALLLGAIITPTDPIVTTPIVTGSTAKERIPEPVRLNMSAESGANDGLAYLFVLLPVLLLTTREPGAAWAELLTKVLLWEVLGAVVLGVALGFGLGALFNLAAGRGFMEETSSHGFVLALAFVVLGTARLAGTDGILAVFAAAAVFGQVVPRSEAKREDQLDDTMNRFVALPAFLLLGIALPVDTWLAAGFLPVLIVTLALLLRRVVGVWLTRPIFAPLHTRSETAFMSWFGPVGISALFYATLAERETGVQIVFPLATLAIAISVLMHGLTTMPWGMWMQRRGRITAGADA